MNYLSDKQIDAFMRATYDAHAVVLDCAFENVYDQPAALAQMLNNDETTPANLDIDAVLPEPADDARNA